MFRTVICSEPVVDSGRTNVDVGKIVSMQPFEPNRTEVKKLDVRRSGQHRTEETTVQHANVFMHTIPKIKYSTVCTNRGKVVNLWKEGTTVEYMFVNQTCCPLTPASWEPMRSMHDVIRIWPVLMPDKDVFCDLHVHFHCVARLLLIR
jgi:hypothetical protein